MSFSNSEFLILLVDDDEANLFTFANNFDDQYRFKSFSDPAEAMKFIEKERFDILITDQRMPKINGMDLIKKAHSKDKNIVSMLFSAFTDIDVLKECVNSNLVFRFLEKPFDFRRLDFEISRAFEARRLRIENEQLKERLKAENAVLREEIGLNHQIIIGADGDLKEILERVREAARYDASVFITGETGTGKEMIARFVHENSPRRQNPFIPLVCSAVSEHLLESELFGHEKGAFTGADKRRIGRFEAADSGTLFLDEIGEVSPEIQVKLLRVLQEKAFERVGGNETIHSDIRLISATNRNIENLIKEEKFRTDLYYRLNVVPVHLPPLRERQNDIGKFADYFIRYFSKKLGKSVTSVSSNAMEVIHNYPWRGNVREMANVFERAVITCRSSQIETEDLGLQVPKEIITFSASDRLSKEKIEEAIKQSGGNKSRASQLLGISRQYLYRKIKELGL